MGKAMLCLNLPAALSSQLPSGQRLEKCLLTPSSWESQFLSFPIFIISKLFLQIHFMITFYVLSVCGDSVAPHPFSHLLKCLFMM